MACDTGSATVDKSAIRTALWQLQWRPAKVNAAQDPRITGVQRGTGAGALQWASSCLELSREFSRALLEASKNALVHAFGPRGLGSIEKPARTARTPRAHKRRTSAHTRSQSMRGRHSPDCRVSIEGCSSSSVPLARTALRCPRAPRQRTSSAPSRPAPVRYCRAARAARARGHSAPPVQPTDCAALVPFPTHLWQHATSPNHTARVAGEHAPAATRVFSPAAAPAGPLAHLSVSQRRTGLRSRSAFRSKHCKAPRPILSFLLRVTTPPLQAPLLMLAVSCLAASSSLPTSP